MTCVVAVSWASGVVLGSDGRVTDESGAILTDRDNKTTAGKGWITGVCGSPGAAWVELKRSSKRTWRQTYAALRRIPPIAAYELLVATKKGILAIDHSGEELCLGAYAAIGSGADTAFGFLTACPEATTRAEAEDQVREAIRIACMRVVTCGGTVSVRVLG